jgi:5-methyltetrahydrofolate--homocysteine methyltransferase
MTGLRLMNEIMDPALRARSSGAPRLHRRRAAAPAAEAAPVAVSEARSPKVRGHPIPPAPYLDRRVRTCRTWPRVWSYINPYMLYGRHLGYKGSFEKALHERDPKALELFHQMEEVKRQAADG